MVQNCETLADGALMAYGPIFKIFSAAQPVGFQALFIIRSATTPFASAASIIKEVNIRASDRRGLKRGTLYI